MMWQPWIVVGAVRSLSLVAVALLVASGNTVHTAGPSGPMYQAAKRQWLGSGLAGGSAGQNVALPVAVRDLRMAESPDAGEKAKYDAALAELEVTERFRRVPRTRSTATPSSTRLLLQ